MKILLLVCALAAGLSVGALSQTPPSNSSGSPNDPFLKNAAPSSSAPPENSVNGTPLLITLETYTLPQEAAAALLLSSSEPTQRYERVTAMVKAGQARLSELEVSACLSSQRFLLRSVDRVGYRSNLLAKEEPNAAETFPTSVSERQKLIDDVCMIVAHRRPTPFEIEQFVQDKSPDAFFQLIQRLNVSPIVTETDPGREFEAEPNLAADGKSCTLNLYLRVTTLCSGNAPEKLNQQWLSSAERRRLEISPVLPIDRPTLVGTLNGPTPAKTNLRESSLCFARVSIVQPPPASEPEASRTAAWMAQAAPNWEYLVSCYSLERGVAQSIVARSRRAGDAFAEVRALSENKEARLERFVTLPSQNAGRVALDSGVAYSSISASAPSVPPVRIRDSKASSAPEAPESRGPEAETHPISPEDIPNFSVEFEGSIDRTASGRTIPAQAQINSLVKWRTMPTPLGDPSFGAQDERRLQNISSCFVGSPALLGTFNPPRETGVNQRADDGRVWLLFLSVNPTQP